MNILQRLTLTNLRENKRRTGVTIIGVMLSTALILAVAGIVTSFQDMMKSWAIAQVGDYHDMYEAVPTEDLKYIEENQHVAKYYYSTPLTDEQLGDSKETYELYPNEPYSASLFEPITTLPADAKGKYNIYVRYDRPGDYDQIRQQILDTLTANHDDSINVRTNSELLRYEGVMGDVTLKSLYSLATLVIGIIIVTSIFVIRNSFSISATERTRQFGMLASIGATPRQIRQSVFFESFVIAAIGIPLGVILGTVAVAILIVIMNLLLDGMMITSIAFSMPFWIFPVAILLSLVTILLSSLMPAIRSGRISPIEAIRGNQDVKIKPRKLRTGKLIRQTFGIGGVIANKNLKRSRKKYRTTVISIVLSVATFIGLASFLDYGQRATSLQFNHSHIDFAINGGSIEFYRDLVKRFNLQDYAYYQNTYGLADGVTIMSQDAFEKYAKSIGLNLKDYSHAAILNDQAIALNDDGGYSYLRQYPDIKEGDTINVEVIERRELEQAELGDDGTQAEYQTKYNYIDLPITKISDTKPLGFENSYYSAVFIPENHYLADKFLPDPDEIQFIGGATDNLAAVSEYLTGIDESEKFEHFNFIDVQETSAQMRRFYLLVSIFLYGFVIVVTLIGVTNIFNTITTNIALRANEFAILRSVGMTNHEFNRMIRLESLMYTGKALLIGIPLGILFSYGVYSSIASSIDFGFQFPLVPILISILAVALLIAVIMRYSVKQVAKQNIIETIRSENI